MLSFTAEYLPKTGALGLSLIGGAGMLGAGIWNPIIGGWIDSGRQEALAEGLSGEAAELATGQAALGNIAIFPLILIFAFIALYIFMKRRRPASEGEVLSVPGSAH